MPRCVEINFQAPHAIDATLIPHRCLVVAAATVTTATRSQAWPFTCLPMFSPRRDETWSKECMTLNQTRIFMKERHATTMASRQWASVLLTWYDPVDHVILHGPFNDGGHELRK